MPDTDALIVDRINGESPEMLNSYLARLFAVAEARGWAGRWRGSKLAPWFCAIYRGASGHRLAVDYPGMLICLEWFPGSVPGSDDRELLLLTENGDLADILTCSVNSRLTRMWYAKLLVDVLPSSAIDGVRIVIRLSGDGVGRNRLVSHLDWRGRKTQHEWREGRDQLSGRDEQEVCRIAIAEDGFRVLLPTIAISS